MTDEQATPARRARRVVDGVTRVDLTPTWGAVLPVLLMGYREGTPEGQRLAKLELEHMAEVADIAVAAATKPDLPHVAQAVLSFLADLNGMEWIAGERPAAVDMRQRAVALQLRLFNALQPSAVAS